MFRSIGAIFGMDSSGSEEASSSRRDFLRGLGAVGAAVAVGSAVLPIGSARAALLPDARDAAAPADNAASDEGMEFAQNWRERDRRREDRRREGRRERGGRRMSRREVRNLCRRDRSFRRRNRGLCERVAGRGRPGSCVTIGPITVCD